MAKIFGKEFYLNLNKYNNVASEKIALAQTIQNLCLIEPGTYPNNPELGVGIENYQFEFLDNNTLGEIKSKIDEQIAKFIITEYTIETNVMSNKIGERDFILISAIVSDPNSSSKDSNDKDPINIIFGRDNSKKVLSQIII